MNSAGCRIPHSTTSVAAATAATTAATAAVAEQSFGRQGHDDDYIIDNADLAGMAGGADTAAGASLKQDRTVSDSRGREIDSMGYSVNADESDEALQESYEVSQEARRGRGHCRRCGILRQNAADWGGSVRCAAQEHVEESHPCEPTDADLEAARDRLAQLAADVDETLRST